MQYAFFRCVLFGLSLTLVLSGMASSARAAGDHAEAEAAIRQAGKDYIGALSRGDSKAIADLWTKDGTFTDLTGRTVKVRDLLASGGLDKEQHPQVSVINSTIRFVTDDVAVEQGDCETAASSGPPVKGHFEAIWA